MPLSIGHTIGPVGRPAMRDPDRAVLFRGLVPSPRPDGDVGPYPDASGFMVTMRVQILEEGALHEPGLERSRRFTVAIPAA